MSSIAYIVDRDRIEYHRLSGDKVMNFWRGGVYRNFTDFKVNDLLFFLSKVNDAHNDGEKGIIGYGIFKEETFLTPSKMWEKYDRLNGLSTKENFMRDVNKVSKGNRRIQGLYLEGVVFFQEAIYLSDFNFLIASNTEGYIYLDREDSKMTSKILNRAKESGVDLWYHAMHNSDANVEIDEIKHLISIVAKDISDNNYSTTDKRIVRKLAKSLVKNDNFELIKGSETDCISIIDNRIVIAFGIVFNSKNKALRLKLCLGHCICYKLKISKLWNKDLKITFKIVSDKSLPKEFDSEIERINECING
ncbi:MAG: hypothetical protein ACK5KQ_00890 [Anaerorhabdus sp.]